MRKERLIVQNQARNPSCPACIAYRLHTKAEWDKYHPYRGHGFDGAKWTHPDLAASAGPTQPKEAA